MYSGLRVLTNCQRLRSITVLDHKSSVLRASLLLESHPQKGQAPYGYINHQRLLFPYLYELSQISFKIAIGICEGEARTTRESPRTGNNLTEISGPHRVEIC